MKCGKELHCRFHGDDSVVRGNTRSEGPPGLGQPGRGNHGGGAVRLFQPRFVVLRVEQTPTVPDRVLWIISTFESTFYGSLIDW